MGSCFNYKCMRCINLCQHKVLAEVWFLKGVVHFPRGLYIVTQVSKGPGCCYRKPKDTEFDTDEG